MNGPRAFCPRCKKDVVFVDTGHHRKCTACGFEFELTDPHPSEPNSVASVVMTVSHVLFRVILIIGVVIVVGLAVVFASCAMHF